MKAKVLFEKSSIKCRLEVTHDNGKEETKDFYEVSQLINYCTERNLNVTASDCYIVDEIVGFKEEIEED